MLNPFKKQTEKLFDLIYEEEDFTNAEALLLEVIKTNNQNIEPVLFSEFLALAIDVLYESENFENNDTYNRITKWAESNYQKEKSINIQNAMLLADSINVWLNHKLELIEDLTATDECRISLGLFKDIIQHSNNKNADLIPEYQGFASCSLMVGLTDKNPSLIEDAIKTQRTILQLYQTEKFPKHYNIATFIAGAKRELASTLMEAYEFDRNTYTLFAKEIGDLLQSASNDYERCGTDFDKEYTASLLNRL